MSAPHILTRREFLATSAVALAAPSVVFAAASAEPIIDIHQHTDYGGVRDKDYNIIKPGRTHEELVGHQRKLGITKTILLPAGRPVSRPSTHAGRANGLQSTCSTNEACVALARAYPKEFYFGANEVSDLEDAPAVVEKFLQLGAVVIGEQKFGVQCDSPEMQKLYQLAGAYRVPILMHWQLASFNHGFERFHTMLKKFPNVNFIGHAQTWWANIDRAYTNEAKELSPKGKVTPGGMTDRYLSDYPNMFGDLSAGSGRNAMGRDPEHARSFFQRHQDKLLFGSDCTDVMGSGDRCIGATQLAQIRRFAPGKAVERKLLYENSNKLFRL